MKASIRLLATLLLLVISATTAHAVALGVNKASINYNDVLRNGYAQDYVTVSTDTSQNLSIEYEFTGEIADWMRLKPNDTENLTFSNTNSRQLTVIVEPPEDAANGVYTGQLRLLTGSFARTGGQYGSNLRASFAVDITVEVTGNQIESCTAAGFGIADTEQRFPLELRASMQNTGNVRITPEFEVDIWNQQQTEIVQTATISAEQEVLPTTQDSFLLQFDHELPMGQYWAQVAEPTCDDSQMVTFSIVDIGGISDKGELLRIDNEPWANTDDIIRIAAVFKNVGSRTVNAKFKGTISKDDETVEIIDTDSLQVRPGRTEQLETFFNPTEPGRYEVKGRVIYNNKLTFEKSSRITVRGDVGPRVTGNFIARMAKNPYQVATVMVVIIIAGLMFMIRKEKKKRRY